MFIGAPLTTDKERGAVEHIVKSGGTSLLADNSAIFANFDAELLTGVKTSHDKKAPVPVDLITKDSFQYMGIAVIDLDVNKHVKNDEYFTQRRTELGDACPQFSSKPPSLAYCSHENGFDTELWKPELGQYNGRVGVFKKLDEHGKLVKYCLVAVAGAEVACQELQQTINTRVDEIENWGYTNSDLCLSNEMGYVATIAAANVQRLLADAAEALEVRIPTIKYTAVKLNPAEQSFPSMAVPDKLQPINTIESIGYNMNIYREVCPPTEVTSANNTHYVLQGPAQPIYEFEVGGSRIQHGLPSTTGRSAPLPVNYAGVSLPEEKRAAYESATSHVFWEGSNPINHDVIPGVYRNLARNREQKSPHFLASLIQLGWNSDNVHERWIPVVVKCSDPFLNRK